MDQETFGFLMYVNWVYRVFGYRRTSIDGLNASKTYRAIDESPGISQEHRADKEQHAQVAT